MEMDAPQALVSIREVNELMPEKQLTSREILRLAIADTVFSIRSRRTPSDYVFPETYKTFLSEQQPVVAIHLHDNGLPDLALQPENLLFDSDGVWRLYSIDDQQVLVLGGGSAKFSPWTIAVLKPNLQEIELFTTGERMANGLYADPFETGLIQRLMVLWLACHGGLMVHGCGVMDADKGYLFAGNSGHGKSTMAALWKDHGMVLCDERVIIRHVAGKFRIYGTPWHSDVANVCARSAPLDKIFFLGHDTDNSSRKKTEIVASTMLLKRAYHPFWDKTGMSNTLDFCDRLLQAVPSYELLFKPDEQVLDFIRCVS